MPKHPKKEEPEGPLFDLGLSVLASTEHSFQNFSLTKLLTSQRHLIHVCSESFLGGHQELFYIFDLTREDLTSASILEVLRVMDKIYNHKISD